jgi:hypothetical protein
MSEVTDQKPKASKKGTALLLVSLLFAAAAAGIYFGVPVYAPTLIIADLPLITYAPVIAFALLGVALVLVSISIFAGSKKPDAALAEDAAPMADVQPVADVPLEGIDRFAAEEPAKPVKAKAPKLTAEERKRAKQAEKFQKEAQKDAARAAKEAAKALKKQARLAKKGLVPETDPLDDNWVTETPATRSDEYILDDTFTEPAPATYPVPVAAFTAAPAPAPTVPAIDLSSVAPITTSRDWITAAYQDETFAVPYAANGQPLDSPDDETITTSPALAEAPTPEVPGLEESSFEEVLYNQAPLDEELNDEPVESAPETPEEPVVEDLVEEPIEDTFDATDEPTKKRRWFQRRSKKAKKNSESQIVESEHAPEFVPEVDLETLDDLHEGAGHSDAADVSVEQVEIEAAEESVEELSEPETIFEEPVAELVEEPVEEPVSEPVEEPVSEPVEEPSVEKPAHKERVSRKRKKQLAAQAAAAAALEATLEAPVANDLLDAPAPALEDIQVADASEEPVVDDALETADDVEVPMVDADLFIAPKPKRRWFQRRKKDVAPTERIDAPEETAEVTAEAPVEPLAEATNDETPKPAPRRRRKKAEPKDDLETTSPEESPVEETIPEEPTEPDAVVEQPAAPKRRRSRKTASATDTVEPNEPVEVSEDTSLTAETAPTDAEEAPAAPKRRRRRSNATEAVSDDAVTVESVAETVPGEPEAAGDPVEVYRSALEEIQRVITDRGLEDPNVLSTITQVIAESGIDLGAPADEPAPKPRRQPKHRK